MGALHFLSPARRVEILERRLARAREDVTRMSWMEKRVVFEVTIVHGDYRHFGTVEDAI